MGVLVRIVWLAGLVAGVAFAAPNDWISEGGGRPWASDTDSSDSFSPQESGGFDPDNSGPVFDSERESESGNVTVVESAPFTVEYHTSGAFERQDTVDDGEEHNATTVDPYSPVRPLSDVLASHHAWLNRNRAQSTSTTPSTSTSTTSYSSSTSTTYSPFASSNLGSRRQPESAAATYDSFAPATYHNQDYGLGNRRQATLNTGSSSVASTAGGSASDASSAPASYDPFAPGTYHNQDYGLGNRRHASLSEGVHHGFVPLRSHTHSAEDASEESHLSSSSLGESTTDATDGSTESATDASTSTTTTEASGIHSFFRRFTTESTDDDSTPDAEDHSGSGSSTTTTTTTTLSPIYSAPITTTSRPRYAHLG